MWEFEYVQQHSRNYDRLTRLHEIRINPGWGQAIADDVSSHYSGGLGNLEISWTGRNNDRGTYYQYDQRIVVAKDTRLEVFCHELAHHVNWYKGARENTRKYWAMGVHTADFTLALDHVAELVEWEHC